MLFSEIWMSVNEIKNNNKNAYTCWLTNYIYQYLLRKKKEKSGLSM